MNEIRVDIISYESANIPSQDITPFRGHNESFDSLNKGNYQELVHFISQYDLILKNHLENSSVFTGLSILIQNDLIVAVSNVIMQKMRNEMKDSNFISIILDDTTDVSNKSQLSFILRYCTKDNKVLERFIGFIDIGNSRSADALYEIYKG